MSQYPENVQTGLQTGDWEKRKKCLSRLAIYQQGKEQYIRKSTRKRIKAEATWRNNLIFSVSVKFYLLGGTLLALSSFASIFSKQK